MNEHCAENLSALLRLIEHGEDVPADLRSHLATCTECARLLDAMKRMQSDVDREDAARHADAYHPADAAGEHAADAGQGATHP